MAIQKINNGDKLLDVRNKINNNFSELESNTGVSDYNNLSNKPMINGIELIGNKTSEDLGIEMDIDILESKQDKTDESLTTESKEVVGAINEIKNTVDTVNNSLNDKQNTNDDTLETTSKYIVGAINEVKASVDEVTNSIDTINTGLTDKQDKNDESLETTSKDIVGAINEVKTSVGEVNTGLTDKQDKNDESLETTSKDIVGAINEVNTGLTDIKGVIKTPINKYIIENKVQLPYTDAENGDLVIICNENKPLDVINNDYTFDIGIENIRDIYDYTLYSKVRHYLPNRYYASFRVRYRVTGSSIIKTYEGVLQSDDDIHYTLVDESLTGIIRGYLIVSGDYLISIGRTQYSVVKFTSDSATMNTYANPFLNGISSEYTLSSISPYTGLFVFSQDMEILKFNTDTEQLELYNSGIAYFTGMSYTMGNLYYGAGDGIHKINVDFSEDTLIGDVSEFAIDHRHSVRDIIQIGDYLYIFFAQYWNTSTGCEPTSIVYMNVNNPEDKGKIAGYEYDALDNNIYTNGYYMPNETILILKYNNDNGKLYAGIIKDKAIEYTYLSNANAYDMQSLSKLYINRDINIYGKVKFRLTFDLGGGVKEAYILIGKNKEDINNYFKIQLTQ